MAMKGFEALITGTYPSWNLYGLVRNSLRTENRPFTTGESSGGLYQDQPSSTEDMTSV